jgi:phosphoadenosine phosphosulfate reductase
MIDRDALKTYAAELESADPARIVRWAFDEFGSTLTFATSLGIEDCVITDMIARQSLPISFFTLDTELLFPETYALKDVIEKKYGISIKAVKPQHTVAQQAVHEGAELWLRNPDHCCELRKMQPLREQLAGYSAWMTAIRRDQTPERANAPVVGWDGRFGLVKINPLVRWTAADVQAYVHEHQVPYNPLHDQHYPSIGCVPCTSQVMPGEDPRSGRWRGSEKTECGLHFVKPTKR